MPKFYPIELSKIEAKRGFSFQCPGCGCAHYIQTNKDFKPCWIFNGDVDNPTVMPSILVKAGPTNRSKICHSFIENGKIRFLNDCTHKLAGQTVEIPDWED